MELKPSHEMFVQELIANKGNATLSYSKAFPKAKYASARHSASVLLTNVDIRMRVSELLEAQGLSIIELAKKLKDLTVATKYHNFKDVFGAVPDNNTRLEAIKVALRIHGLLGNKSDVIGLYLSPDKLAQLEKEQEPLSEEEI